MIEILQSVSSPYHWQIVRSRGAHVYPGGRFWDKVNETWDFSSYATYYTNLDEAWADALALILADERTDE